VGNCSMMRVYEIEMIRTVNAVAIARPPAR
jgi:hypothetical protein